MTPSRLVIIALALCVSASAARAYSGATSPQAARAALNLAQAEFARNQLAQDAANQQAYESAVRARSDLIQHNELAYQHAMAQWRADVAACHAGDVGHCARGTAQNNPM